MTKCVEKKTWDMNANKQRIPFTHSQTSILSYALVNLWSILSSALDGPWSLCHGGLGLMPPCPGPPGFSRSDCIQFIFLNAARECIRFILSLPKHLSFILFFSLGLEGGGKKMVWGGFD
jgi:hypothetical protein